MRSRFALDPDVIFLNHGSFGACPREVLAHQSELRAQLEAEPVRFFTRELEPLADAARERLAAFIRCRAEDLAFVTNATTAVSCVLRSLRLEPGDELVTTSHAYNACANALRFVAEHSGALVRVAQVPFPIESSAQLTDAVRAACGPRTKLVLLDTVTSPTALVCELRALVTELEARDVMVLLDAAHEPGMVPMKVAEVGASFTTGNLHKWVCAPKGAAFLHVRADRQELVRPLVISHGANATRPDRSRFRLEFDWMGTTDPTAALCVGKALEVVGRMHAEGWEGVMRENRELVSWARAMLSDVLSMPRCAPEAMLGSMACVALPGSGSRSPQEADPLQRRLLEEHHIEVPVFGFQGTRVLRVSAHRHNSRADYEALAKALPSALARE